MTTSPSNSNSRTLAAVAYILTWITGLIIYFVAKDDKYARWHAIQAIGLGIFAFVVSVILRFLPFSFTWIWWVLTIVAVVVLAVKAYQGEKLRLPLIADWADKHA